MTNKESARKVAEAFIARRGGGGELKQEVRQGIECFVWYAPDGREAVVGWEAE